MSDEVYLTVEGAEKLRKELEHLKGEERQKLAERLHDAVSMGDLSENADYHAAKEYQSFLEGRIQELEDLLQRAVIVEPQTGITDHVGVGTTVTIQEEDFRQRFIRSWAAKNPTLQMGVFPNESPIGSALLDKQVGDVVLVQIPEGEICF